MLHIWIFFFLLNNCRNRRTKKFFFFYILYEWPKKWAQIRFDLPSKNMFCTLMLMSSLWVNYGTDLFVVWTHALTSRARLSLLLVAHFSRFHFCYWFLLSTKRISKMKKPIETIMECRWEVHVTCFETKEWYEMTIS